MSNLLIPIEYVVELIRAAREVNEIFEDRRGHEFFDHYHAPFRRLTTALASLGGAAPQTTSLATSNQPTETKL